MRLSTAILSVSLCLAGCATHQSSSYSLEDQHRAQVQADIEWPERTRAIWSGDPQVSEAFLSTYPHSIYRSTVEDHLKELYANPQDYPQFLLYKQQDTLAGYEEFIMKYPQNSYVAAARNRQGEIAYLQAHETKTAAALQAFLAKYPDHPYASNAREELGITTGSHRSGYARRIGTLIVTAGPLSQRYEALGEVHVNTRGMINFGSILNDSLFRSRFAVAAGGRTANANEQQMNELLKQQVRSQYGERADAVINVTYRIDHDGIVYASGLVVQFIEEKKEEVKTASPPALTLEARLKELKSLREKNLITPEEYYDKRSKLLEGL